MVIDYGVPITNAVGGAPVPTDDGTPLDNSISVLICSTAANDRETTDANAKVDGNMITITVPAATACTVNNTSGAIDVSGVRLSLVGSGLDSVPASVTSTGDIRLLGGANTVTVINSVVDELTDAGIEVVKGLTLIRHTGLLDDDSKDDAPANQFKLLIMENTGAFLR